MFRTGALGPLVFLVLLCAIVYIALRLVKKGKVLSIRSLPAMDAIEEAVGRASEMGKPVFFTGGISSLETVEAPIAGASMSFLGQTSRLTARYGADICFFLGPINLVPVAQDVIRTGYAQEGMDDAYKSTMVRWVSDSQLVYCAAFMGACEREKPAAHIMMGGFWFESILLAEGGKAVGALTVGGTPRQGQIHFLVAICDYVLVGEEYYAAAAKITNDPDDIASIWGEDIYKMILLFLLLAGSVLQALKIDWIKGILTL